MIESAELIIKDNGIVFENTVIQISNITRIWAGEIPKKPLSIMYVIIGAIVGFLFLSYGISGDNGGFIVVGLTIFAMVIRIVLDNKSQVQYYALNIELNSGSLHSFTSPQDSFINKAFKILSDIICEELKVAKYTLNFGNGTVINEVNDSKVRM